MSDLTQQTLDAIQWVREYHHDGGTMNYHHLAILELTDALTAANVREAALRKEAAEAKEWEAAASAEEDAKLELIDDLAAARAELGALGPVEYMVNTDAHGWRVTHISEWEHVRSIDTAKTDIIRRVLEGGAQ